MPRPTLAERANFPLVTFLVLMAVIALCWQVQALNEAEQAYQGGVVERHVTAPKFEEE